MDIIASILAEIKDIVALYPGYELVMGGDFNVVLGEISRATDMIRNFLTDLLLSVVTDLIHPNCDHTYFHDSQQLFSFVDYFMFSSSLMNDCLEFKIPDDMINMSDHHGIYLSLMLPMLIHVYTLQADMLTNNSNLTSRPTRDSYRLRWDHAPLPDYYALSYERLIPVLRDIEPFYDHCFNIVNDDSNTFDLSAAQLKGTATKFIELVYQKLTNILADTAERIIPKTGPATLKEWWNEELKDLKKMAMEPHKQWISAGKPRQGVIADIRKKDKYAYKFAIRKYKNSENSKKTESLFDTLSSTIVSEKFGIIKCYLRNRSLKLSIIKQMTMILHAALPSSFKKRVVVIL